METVHPSGFEPMLASTSRRLDGDGWAFEPKLDGWRAIVHVLDHGVAVYSRPGREITESVPQLSALTKIVPAGTVLDGELVAGSGRSSTFYQLSPTLGRRSTTVTFAAFDLLAVDGCSLVWRSYEERRRLLGDVLRPAPGWCVVPAWTHVEVSDLLAACELEGVEGLVAKRVRSRYRPGRRSPDWVKRKCDGWYRDHAPRRQPGGWATAPEPALAGRRGPDAAGVGSNEEGHPSGPAAGASTSTGR